MERLSHIVTRSSYDARRPLVSWLAAHPEHVEGVMGRVVEVALHAHVSVEAGPSMPSPPPASFRPRMLAEPPNSYADPGTAGVLLRGYDTGWSITRDWGWFESVVVVLAPALSPGVRRSWEEVPGSRGVYYEPGLNIKVDVQSAEVLCNDQETRPVPESMSSFSDFEVVFGKEALRCAFKFRHEHRQWVQIVGEEHELLEWDTAHPYDQGVGASRPALASRS